MAKSALSLKPTRAKQPGARRPKFADERYMGPEPEENYVVESSDSRELSAALQWYNYFYDADQARDWLVQYMGANDYQKEYVHAIKTLPGWRVARTDGTLAKLMLRGWSLPPDMVERFNRRIIETANIKLAAKQEKVSAPNIQDRTKDRAKYFAYTLLDEEIDNFYNDLTYTTDLYTILGKEKASPQSCGLMRERINAFLEELSKKDGFENFNKKKLTAYQNFYKSMLSDLDKFQNNKKIAKPRKPRTVKAKPVEKIIGQVKYMKEFAELKLVSVSPDQVLGAKTLYTYNTKYKQLAMYQALDDKGLGVKGTTLTNFNPDTSVVKRLRKPELVTQSVLTSGKVPLRNIMSGIKTAATPATGRLNADTILLRSIK